VDEKIEGIDENRSGIERKRYTYTTRCEEKTLQPAGPTIR
jgi:hypothetical protein